ncbi:uncharacterized protein LAESUDRAFT_743205 [Laetiporus sulphureus 93-53]|uniref:Amino acid transporter transmembrane domain-containing protein n=1 Tax=Laetiporus sulphureus 93-53 TaxID=1314785 RepID=A0A165EEJ4_9APHY|nr:uncharacterized protein LAESUDRAFT_743205 [Laetiporus sulphureus 93-53]KZT06885.1 hypothetical protein LAESUDRAFT_743205 [Laetiporus sulphureus 93-53]
MRIYCASFEPPLDRRAQEYLSESVSASVSGASDDEGYQTPEEPLIEEEEDETPFEQERQGVQPYDDLIPGPSQISVLAAHRPFLLPVTSSRRPTLRGEEEPAESYLGAFARTAAVVQTFANAEAAVQGALARRTSQLSISQTTTGGRKREKVLSGHSTYGQTLFNAIAILLGIGMLSEPLAFAYAGWIDGTVIIIFYGIITCYTGKILAHLILDDPRLKSYSDIGKKAFGPRSGPWISALFCLELFTVSGALVTLYADSLYAVLPACSSDTYKLVGLFVLTPTMLLPLSLLSYTSILGILSTILIIAVILIDGLSKRDSPGSIWSPAETTLGVRSVGQLGLSYGLFMAGFSGHAVIPSLVRDMVDPTQFDSMITHAFTVATTVYAVIGVAGYIMFGNEVSDEFSQDLAKYTVYPNLNKIALWSLVLAPLSKFAVAARPLNLTLEMMLGIEIGPVSVNDHGTKPIQQDAESAVRPHRPQRTVTWVYTFVERTLFTICSVTVSICVPEFSSTMAFLGAFSSFLLCVIGPVSAKVALARHCTSGLIMATWGTIAAFWSMQ